jgi:hypothetical protein
MKIFIKIVAVLLLLINGVGTLYGGFNLIKDPSGGLMQMPLSYLEDSPFSNYLIPGIVLFCVNGVFSFVALIALISNLSVAAMLIMAQGLLLSGWIIVQIILLQNFYPPLHIPFLFIGLLLFISGYYLKREY